MSFESRNEEFPYWVTQQWWIQAIEDGYLQTNQNTWETRDFVFTIIYYMTGICPIIGYEDYQLNRKYYTLLGTLITQITNWVLKFQHIGSAKQIVPQWVITMVITDASYWANNNIMFSFSNYTNAEQFISFLVTFIRTLEIGQYCYGKLLDNK